MICRRVTSACGLINETHESSKLVVFIFSGQIIATSHDLTPKGSSRREIPLFQGNLGWWNIIIWPDIFYYVTWNALSTKLKVDGSTPQTNPLVRGYHMPLCGCCTILSFAKLAVSIGDVEGCSNLGQHVTVEVNSKLLSLSKKKPCLKLIGPNKLMSEVWWNTQRYSKWSQMFEF